MGRMVERQPWHFSIAVSGFGTNSFQVEERKETCKAKNITFSQRPMVCSLVHVAYMAAFLCSVQEPMLTSSTPLRKPIPRPPSPYGFQFSTGTNALQLPFSCS